MQALVSSGIRPRNNHRLISDGVESVLSIGSPRRCRRLPACMIVHCALRAADPRNSRIRNLAETDRAFCFPAVHHGLPSVYERPNFSVPGCWPGATGVTSMEPWRKRYPRFSGVGGCQFVIIRSDFVDSARVRCDGNHSDPAADWTCHGIENPIRREFLCGGFRRADHHLSRFLQGTFVTSDITCWVAFVAILRVRFPRAIERDPHV